MQLQEKKTNRSSNTLKHINCKISFILNNAFFLISQEKAKLDWGHVNCFLSPHSKSLTTISIKQRNAVNEGAVSFRNQFPVKVQYPFGANGWGALLAHVIHKRGRRVENLLRLKDIASAWCLLRLWCYFCSYGGEVITVFLGIAIAIPIQTLAHTPTLYPPMTGRDTNSPKLHQTQIRTRKKWKKNNTLPQGDHIYWSTSARTEEIREWEPTTTSATARTNPSTVTWCQERVRWSGGKVLTSLKTPRLSGICWKTRGTVHSDAPSQYKATMDTITQVKQRFLTGT